MAEPTYLRLQGHDELRDRLATAVLRGRLPRSLLLHGAPGIGKQRLAIWLAAALQCSGEARPPCGRCRACRLVGELEHPDVHWFFPVPRPRRASSPDRLEEKLEDIRAEILEERRRDAAYLEDRESTTGIYVGVVRIMRRLAHAAPHMGPRKVLIIGHAEALVPQRGNPEAANALLKLLEEPPADTHLLLTSEVPGALLPTVRSRVQAIRVAPLSLDIVARFIQEHSGLTEDEARKMATRSGGSIGRALELADEEGDELRNAARRLVHAALHPSTGLRHAVAHSRAPAGARGEFSELLRYSADLLRDVLAVAVGAPDAAADRETAQRLLTRTTAQPRQILETLHAIQDARELADRNVNPQLITANLLRRAAEAATSVDAGTGTRTADE